MENSVTLVFPSFSQDLLGYLYRLSGNKEDAQDLLHDTFIRATEKEHTFRGESSLKTWVYAIATNLARDHKRVQNRWPADAQDQCKTTVMESADYMQRLGEAFHNQTEKKFELEEHINYCFTCLAKNISLEKQIAIILKDVYAFSRDEVASILGVTEGVVKHLLFEGRKELQEKYHYRCALINKNGICYQCAELNDHFEGKPSAASKVQAIGLDSTDNPQEQLRIRLQLISKIHPLQSNGAALEDTIMQLLREAIGDK